MAKQVEVIKDILARWRTLLVSTKDEHPAGDRARAEMKLTPKQAAAVAGVSVSLVYQCCEERHFTHSRCGSNGRRGRILIEASELLTFLQSCRVEPERGRAARARPGPPADRLQPAGLCPFARCMATARRASFLARGTWFSVIRVVVGPMSSASVLMSPPLTTPRLPKAW